MSTSPWSPYRPSPEAPWNLARAWTLSRRAGFASTWAELQRDLAAGLVDYCPWRYNIIDAWLGEDGRFDTALVMVSPPDDMGNCSLGTQMDFLPTLASLRRRFDNINRKLERKLEIAQRQRAG